MYGMLYSFMFFIENWFGHQNLDIKYDAIWFLCVFLKYMQLLEDKK